MNTMIAFCRKHFWIAGVIAALSGVAIAQMQPRAMSFMHAMKESMDRMDNGMNRLR